MPRPEVRVVILYEDKVHDSFLRRLVEHFNLRPVRFEKCVDSTGVLRSLSREVDALRARRHQRNLGLVVCIDADDLGLLGRIAELERRIADDARDGERVEGERIAFLVPALEIEAWYMHLCLPEARPIDESRDYKRSPEWRQLSNDLGAASRRAVEAWPLDPGRADPPSLTSARSELARVV